MLLIALSFHSVFEVGNLEIDKQSTLLLGSCHRPAEQHDPLVDRVHCCDHPQGRDGLQPWPQHRSERALRQGLRLVQHSLQPGKPSWGGNR